MSVLFFSSILFECVFLCFPFGCYFVAVSPLVFVSIVCFFNVSVFCIFFYFSSMYVLDFDCCLLFADCHFLLLVCGFQFFWFAPCALRFHRLNQLDRQRTTANEANQVCKNL